VRLTIVFKLLFALRYNQNGFYQYYPIFEEILNEKRILTFHLRAIYLSYGFNASN